VVAELTIRLQSDPIAQEQFYHSFGLGKMHHSRVLRDISELFPDTPVRLLKDIFEALELYDLAELLEKAKPRSLRPALPQKEIGKLPNASNRPTTFYSKASVLIITPTRSANDEAERMASFFKELSSGSEVNAISVQQKFELVKQIKMLKKKSEGNRYHKGDEKLKERRLKRLMEEREDLTTELESVNGESLRFKYLERELNHVIQEESWIRKELERRKQWTEEEKPKIEKEIKQKGEELQQERDKLKMAVSTVVDRWTHMEGWSTFKLVPHVSVSRFVSLSVCLSVCLSISPPFCLPTCQCGCRFLHSTVMSPVDATSAIGHITGVSGATNPPFMRNSSSSRLCLVI